MTPTLYLLAALYVWCIGYAWVTQPQNRGLMCGATLIILALNLS